MKTFLRGTLGALALAAAAALPLQAAQAQAAPLASAVFHPGETPAAVQTVQYYSHYHPHRRFFHHRHPDYHRGVYHRRHHLPFRHY